MTVEVKSKWEQKSLGDCLLFLSRGVAPSYVSDSPITALNQKAIRWGYIERGYLKYHDPAKRVKQDVFIRQGDIVVNSTGDITIGRAYYFNKPWPNLFADSHVTILRLNSEVLLPEFCIYLFPLPEYQSKIYSLVTGATGQLELSKSNLSKLEVVVPPISTQRKIGTILSAYDDLIENNLRRIKILEDMAQNLYREWFVKFRFPGHQKARFKDSFLGSIPQGWEVKRLDQVVFFKNHGTEAGEHLSDRVYLPIDCIPRKSLAISEISSWKDAQSSLQLFDVGDILFGAMRPYFHKVVVAPFKGVTRKTCFVFKSALPEYHAFAALTLFQDSTVSFANAHCKGATIPYAVWPQSMDGMSVVVPPIEQAEKFEEAVGPMISRIGTMYFQNTTLRRTRDMLLPQLLSGQVNVEALEVNNV